MAYKHPYQPEIESLAFPSWILDPPVAGCATSTKDIGIALVSDVAALSDMLLQLEAVDVVAVSAHQHNYRSFQGYISVLMVH